MKLTRSREHVINMGNYESVRVGASIEVEVDLTSKEAEKAAFDAADIYLASAMESDLKEAIDLLPGGSNSYILSWGVKEQNA